MKYYFYEGQNMNDCGKYDACFETKNITSAKRAASRRQIFQGTCLFLSTEIDQSGRLIRPVAIKKDGGWLDYEYEYAPESEYCDSDGFIKHFGIIKRE